MRQLKEYLDQIDHLEARFGDMPPRPRFGGLLLGGFLIAFTACACKGPWWSSILLTAVFVPLFLLIYYDANSKKGSRKRSRDGPRQPRGVTQGERPPRRVAGQE